MWMRRDEGSVQRCGAKLPTPSIPLSPRSHKRVVQPRNPRMSPEYPASPKGRLWPLGDSTKVLQLHRAANPSKVVRYGERASKRSRGLAVTKTCPDCNGDGVVDKDTDDERQCPTCGGLSFVRDDDDQEEAIKTSR